MRREPPPTIWSLAYLTAAPLSAPETVSMAAELGYQAVGMRALPAAPGGDFWPLIADKAALAETRSRLADTGVTVFDMEIIRLGADFDGRTVAPFLDVASALGAKAVLVAGDDTDRSRLAASFAAFCDAAAPHGLTADLEFMPWTAVRNCADARAIVETADRPNGRILVDSLHAARSGTTIADLAALPRGMLSYAQICDAPVEIPTTTEGLIHTARLERLLPGEGGIDLRAMFATLPDDIPISIELPNEAAKTRLGVREWARRALESSRRVLDAARSSMCDGDAPAR
jgi:sugar phosphate isomerase/epimerase